MRSLIKRKKAGAGIVFFFIAIILVLIIGFGMTMVWSVLDIANDSLYPALRGLGVIEGVDANVTEYIDYGFGVTDTFISSIPWLVALGYVLALIFTLVFVYMADYQPHPALLAFYFIMMVLIIFGCVVMSNIYESFYQGTSEIAIRLKEQGIMSNLIIHSPFIMSLIAVIGGILMFTRTSRGERLSGGYGV